VRNSRNEDIIKSDHRSEFLAWKCKLSLR